MHWGPFRLHERIWVNEKVLFPGDFEGAKPLKNYEKIILRELIS